MNENVEKVTLKFKLERETKRTLRYEEQSGDTPPVVGTLYVQKWWAQGAPTIEVTLEKS